MTPDLLLMADGFSEVRQCQKALQAGVHVAELCRVGEADTQRNTRQTCEYHQFFNGMFSNWSSFLPVVFLYFDLMATALILVCMCVYVQMYSPSALDLLLSDGLGGGNGISTLSWGYRRRNSWWDGFLGLVFGLLLSLKNRVVQSQRSFLFLCEGFKLHHLVLIDDRCNFVCFLLE